MLRIFARLAWCIPLLFVLTIALEAYGRILPQTPDALLDICALPCLLGVTPNLTQAAEVEDILSMTLPNTDRTLYARSTLGDTQYLFSTIVDEQYVSGYIALSSNGTQVAAVNLNAQFPLAVLFEKWGTPTCVNVDSQEGVAVVGMVAWERADYYLQALFLFLQRTEPWANASVQSLVLRGSGTGCAADMQAWQGFAPPWRYQ
jgi:hypothetical protein